MLGLAITGALALQAAALAQGRTPTDVELKSAYCIKVLQAQQTDTAAALQTPGPDPRITAALQAGYAGTADRLARLRAYLVPRASSLDPVALTAAMNRGGADAAAFTREVETIVATSGREPDVELTRRVQSCSKVDWLPF